jgi:hypothetical protein
MKTAQGVNGREHPPSEQHQAGAPETGHSQRAAIGERQPSAKSRHSLEVRHGALRGLLASDSGNASQRLWRLPECTDKSSTHTLGVAKASMRGHSLDWLGTALNPFASGFQS